MINRASNKIIKNICDTLESLYLPSKFGTHCCDKTVVYIFASSLVSSITLCYGFTVLMYFIHRYLFLEFFEEWFVNCASTVRVNVIHETQGRKVCFPYNSEVCKLIWKEKKIRVFFSQKKKMQTNLEKKKKINR